MCIRDRHRWTPSIVGRRHTSSPSSLPLKERTVLAWACTVQQRVVVSTVALVVNTARSWSWYCRRHRPFRRGVCQVLCSENWRHSCIDSRRATSANYQLRIVNNAVVPSLHHNRSTPHYHVLAGEIVLAWHRTDVPRTKVCRRSPAVSDSDGHCFCVRTTKETFPYWKLLFLSSIFKTAVAQKLCSGFCWNLQRLHRKDDN